MVLIFMLFHALKAEARGRMRPVLHGSIVPGGSVCNIVACRLQAVGTFLLCRPLSLNQRNVTSACLLPRRESFASIAPKRNVARANDELTF